MLRIFSLFLIAFTASITSLAAEDAEFGGDCIDRDQWCSRPFVALKMKKQEFPLERIIISSTGNNLNYDIEAKLRNMQDAHMNGFGYPDIACNYALSLAGDRYECRPLIYEPNTLANSNHKTCAISLLADFDGKDGSDEITDELVNAWGKQIGTIAFEGGMRKLEHKKNIWGNSELSMGNLSSPGVKFLERMADVIAIANSEIELLVTERLHMMQQGLSGDQF